jgi:Cu/Ag efflux protein CusF
MKTKFTRNVSLLGVAICALLGANIARADGQNPPAAAVNPDSKTYEGTVTAVDPLEKTLTVKGTLFSKTFNVSDACQVSLEDKAMAGLNDLRPGHQVEVQFQNVQGVLAAGHVQQHNRVLDGYIARIDPAQRTLVIKDGPSKKELVVAEDCIVRLKDEKIGTLENLKVGHVVRVAYEPTDKTWTARKIEQQAESFVGTIQAIDATSRTVKARSFMSERKFNLADGCRIVVDGKADAGLRDLRIGDKVEFSYEEANGVLVANRIGHDANLPEPEAAHTAKAGR